MNDIQLCCFIAAADTLNFSKAAEQMYFSKATVTHYIQTLESELGTKLFIRTKKSVSLIIDFFGKHVSFHEREDGMISCRLLVSREAMKHWAVEHANLVRVVSPSGLVEEIREELRKAFALYEMENRI